MNAPDLHLVPPARLVPPAPPAGPAGPAALRARGPSGASAPPVAREAPGAPAAVLLVEDHRLLSSTLALALRAVGLHVRVAADLGAEAVVADVRALRESRGGVLVLMDLDLGAAGCGADLVAPVRAAGAAVLVVTGSPDGIGLARALQAGALGWARKDLPFDELVGHVGRAARGESVGDPAERAELLAALHREAARRARCEAAAAALTPRERAVLRALAAGARPEDIAEASFVSVGTVRTQVKSIFRKLDVNNQLAAVAAAHRLGLVDAEG